MLQLRILLFAFISYVSSIDWKTKELKLYDFSSQSLVFKATHYSSSPAPHTETWFFGLNSSIQDAKSECAQGADACGIFVYEDKDSNRKVQAISIGPDYDEILYQPNRDGIVITQSKDQKSMKIRFVCFHGDDESFEVDDWNPKSFTATIHTKGACLALRDIPEGKSPAGLPRELWGWFTWIFIFLVLFSSIYIIGGAWFQYNKGNAIDFSTALKEVAENGLDILKGMPAFIREIIEKVTSSRSNRGEYSAV